VFKLPELKIVPGTFLTTFPMYCRGCLVWVFLLPPPPVARVKSCVGPRPLKLPVRVLHGAAQLRITLTGEPYLTKSHLNVLEAMQSLSGRGRRLKTTGKKWTGKFQLNYRSPVFLLLKMKMTIKLRKIIVKFTNCKQKFNLSPSHPKFDKT
jgi:hypothetical protein